MNALNIRDKDGNFVGIPMVSGADGKSAYQYAVEGGFNGTEEEFMMLLGSIPQLKKDIDQLANVLGVEL